MVERGRGTLTTRQMTALNNGDSDDRFATWVDLPYPVSCQEGEMCDNSVIKLSKSSCRAWTPPAVAPAIEGEAFEIP
jgi:hypothetical protein